VKLDAACRSMVVEESIVVEIKAVGPNLRQFISRSCFLIFVLSGKRVGLLINSMFRVLKKRPEENSEDFP